MLNRVFEPLVRELLLQATRFPGLANTSARRLRCAASGTAGHLGQSPLPALPAQPEPRASADVRLLAVVTVRNHARVPRPPRVPPSNANLMSTQASERWRLGRVQTASRPRCGARDGDAGRNPTRKLAPPHERARSEVDARSRGSELHCVRCDSGRPDPRVADPFVSAGVVGGEGQPFRARAVTSPFPPSSSSSSGSCVWQLASLAKDRE